MSKESDYIWYLKFKISVLNRQLESFRSGNKYKSIREEYETICRKKDREIEELKKKLVASRKETSHAIKIWMQAADDEHEKCENLLKNADRIIKEKQDRIYEVKRQRDEALDKLNDLRKRYAELSERCEDQEDKLTKLTARVNKDFENSSIPSSQQGLNRKKIPNSREKTNRKAGGQPGHKGHRLVQRRPDESHKIPDPPKYSESKDYYKTGEVIKRQKIVIEVRAKIIEYCASVFRHRDTGSRVHANFPEGYYTDIQYDSSVKAFAYLLANDGNMSCGKIRCILRELSYGSIDISEATINGLLKEFSLKSDEDRTELISELMCSPVVNTDFTNANVNGESAQVLIMAAPDANAYIYMARDSKGHAGIEGTPIETYAGTLVHDHDKTFYNYGIHHQECMQHNSRNLKGSIENEPELEWNKMMYALLNEILDYRKNLKDETVNKDKEKEFVKRYDEILKIAQKEYEDNPPGKYYREGYNLYKRLEEYKDSQLLFLYDTRVPPDNSLAERLARKYKRKQKQAMVLRSYDNFEYLCNGLSIINTYRRREYENLYDVIIGIFEKQKPKTKKPAGCN